MTREAPIVGTEVPDQTRLRPANLATDLDEFLEFLARLEAVFGPVARAGKATRGTRFLL